MDGRDDGDVVYAAFKEFGEIFGGFASRPPSLAFPPSGGTCGGFSLKGDILPAAASRSGGGKFTQLGAMFKLATAAAKSAVAGVPEY